MKVYVVIANEDTGRRFVGVYRDRVKAGIVAAQVEKAGLSQFCDGDADENKTDFDCTCDIIETTLE